MSVVVRGHHLDRLPVTGGQFLNFRFLKRGMWWRGHPYSISALPGGNEMRITVKAAGEHSTALAELEPGTPVAIEGPYGAFTQHARETDRVLLVGAGVGVTPVRAHARRPAATRRRGRHPARLERRASSSCATRSGGSWTSAAAGCIEVVGPRAQAPLDAGHLQRLVPDITTRDLYVCGPGGFMKQLIGQARSLGVPEGRIHHEEFAF